jgi:CSLREA domain-containing protein
MAQMPRPWLPKWITPNRPRAAWRATAEKARLLLLALEDRLTPNTYTVTTTADVVDPNDGQLSLREALIAANSPGQPGLDTIAFSNTTANGATNFYDGSPHTIGLSAVLPTITDSISITGAGPGLTVIDAISPTNQVSVGRVFTIDHSVTSSALVVTFQGLTVEHGAVTGAQFAQGGGILFAGGAPGDTLTIDTCAITGNAAIAGSVAGVGGQAQGGGVWVTGVALTLSNSTLAGNSAQGGTSSAHSNDPLHAAAYGGGLYAAAATVTVRNNSFIANNTAQGGNGSTEQTGPGSVGGRAYGGGV